MTIILWMDDIALEVEVFEVIVIEMTVGLQKVTFTDGKLVNKFINNV